MRSKTFNISLPEDLIKKADQVAKQEYRSRSELMREALRKYIRDMEEWENLMAYGKKQARKKGITTSDEVDAIVRQYRHGK